MSKKASSRRTGVHEDDGPSLFPVSLPSRPAPEEQQQLLNREEVEQQMKGSPAAAASRSSGRNKQALKQGEKSAARTEVAEVSQNDEWERTRRLESMQHSRQKGKKKSKGKESTNDSRSTEQLDNVQENNDPSAMTIQPGAVAVAVAGRGGDDSQSFGRRNYDSTVRMESHRENRVAVSQQQQDASHLPDATPIAAELVQPHQDIQTQVDSRVREQTQDIEDQVRRQIIDEAVHADVVEDEIKREDETSWWTMKRKVLVGGLAAILLVAIAVGVTLGVVLGGSSNGDSSTPVPSPAPTGRVDILRDFLEAEFGEEIAPNSPQEDAVDWLAFSDPQQLDPDSVPNRILMERYVIALLYFATNGTSWVDQFGFLNASSVCSWHQGRDSFLGRGVFCEAGDDSVTHIQMDSNNLVGKFPSEIIALASLERIELRNNALSGTIPERIGDLSALVNFIIEENKFSGTIPESLFDLQQLSTLDAASNRDITGTLPANMGNARRLYTLHLGNCRLRGSIPPSIDQLTALYNLSLASNSLTGNVPSLSSRGLRNVLLSFNALNGTISSSLGSLQNLHRLDLRQNALRGSIPSLQGSTSLGIVWLHDNELTGTIGEVLATLPTSRLVDLNLRTNRLEGLLTADVGRFTELTALRVNENDLLTGTIPTEIGQLTNLREYLRLNECSFEGTIPTEMGRLTGLWRMSLSKNNLNGTIPSELGLLSTMSSANFQQNRLTGTLPVEVASLPVLDYLFLDNNVMTGDVGPFICNRTFEHVFSADCLGPEPEIECSCCTTCCRQDPENFCE